MRHRSVEAGADDAPLSICIRLDPLTATRLPSCAAINGFLAERAVAPRPGIFQFLLSVG